MGSIGALFLSLAVLIGIIHAVYVYRQEAVSPRTNYHDDLIGSNLRASYYALWTLALWVVLGTYIVGLWLLAIVPYVIVKVMGKTLSTPKVQSVR